MKRQVTWDMRFEAFAVVEIEILRPCSLVGEYQWLRRSCGLSETSLVTCHSSDIWT
jgi:hypothetical protein